MRFWKGSAYLTIEFNGVLQKFDAEDDDGRRLALDFETKHTSGKEPNQGVFALYNLSESSREAVASTDRKTVRCYAGYDGNEKLIYQGDVVRVNNMRSGADWMTEIQCGDGYLGFTQAVTSRSYAAGTDKEFILRQMAADMDLVLKQAEGTITGLLSGPQVFDGRTRDTMETLLKDQGAQYSIQDGEIRVAPIGQPIDMEAIVLRADTGLLEHPQITEKGVNIRAQLNPDIRPGKLIKLEPTGTAGATVLGKNYAGVYICQNVSFVGNNYGGPFDVIIEAKAYD